MPPQSIPPDASPVVSAESAAVRSSKAATGVHNTQSQSPEDGQTPHEAGSVSATAPADSPPRSETFQVGWGASHKMDRPFNLTLPRLGLEPDLFMLCGRERFANSPAQYA